ncbi:hypothetical protein [Hymenobacter psychrophilus]|uniref:hypothetical protein n=1 Tax=Hymenobacter psychrophilus TaxID=651662 RepID=UPI001114D7AB|nr:hypothetical protein [Hymenobacter psychrophilus]
MKKALLLVLTLLPVFGFSQVISKSKSETMQNIKNAGYIIKPSANGNSILSYTRYDEHGEAIVSVKCENNLVRQVTFSCTPARSAPLRVQDIMRTMTRAEMQAIREKYGNWAQPDASIITQSSKYYKGEARYSSEVTNDGMGVFTITPL